jgi:hypothetical protein
MAHQIGERFDLSDDAFVTLYYDGEVTLIKDGGTIYLDVAETTVLREVLAKAGF